MRLSLKTICKHWWKFLAFLLVLLPFNLCGVLCCFVGVFVTLPVSFAALMYAYEDIFNPSGLPPALPAGSTVPGAGSGAPAYVKAQPHRLVSLATLYLTGAVIILLLAFAALAGLNGKPFGYCLALAAVALAFAIFLRARKSALPSDFMATFLLVFLLVLGTAVFIT